MHAGLEGIEKGYELPEPMERNLYDLSPTEREKMGVKSLPADLGEAIHEAENSELLQKALGEHAFTRLMQLKRDEFEEYRVQVTPLRAGEVSAGSVAYSDQWLANGRG